MFGFFNKKRKSILYKGNHYTDEILNELQTYYYEKWFEENPLPIVDKYSKNDQTQLSSEQIEKLKTFLLKKKANSWKSQQRRKRKEGKLSQDQIDKLNSLGMIWNPGNDEWEDNFSLFKHHGLIDPLQTWVETQREKYAKGTLNQENFQKLKAVNFPFIKSENELFALTQGQIYHMKEQLLSGREEFDPNLKNYSQQEPEKIKSIKNRKKSDDLSLAHKNKLISLQKKSDEDFIEEIDKLFNKEYIYSPPTSGFAKSKQSHYSDIYFESFQYIKGVFNTKNFEQVKFVCSDKVVIYCCERAVSFLDEKMLPSGKYNDFKSFPPVAKLIGLYSKNKRPIELKNLDHIIAKHQVLEVIYRENMDKALFKLKLL